MAKKTPPTVILNLSGIMDQRDLSADEVSALCEKAGTPISRTTVFHMKSGRADAIRLTSIAALCNGLDITPCDLFIYEKKGS